MEIILLAMIVAGMLAFYVNKTSEDCEKHGIGKFEVVFSTVSFIGLILLLTLGVLALVWGINFFLNF